jgi:hypothetical protein
MSNGQVQTAAQREQSFKETYWYSAIHSGLEYYVTGRYGVHAQVWVSANLLHHAVELLIKANLARDDSADQIRQYGRKAVYSHSLAAAWQEFKKRSGDKALDAFDKVVAELDKWESIRYPDQLVSSGGVMTIELVESPAPPAGAPASPAPPYRLALPEIDRLVKFLVERSNINLAALSLLLDQKHAARYFTETNSSPLR